MREHPRSPLTPRLVHAGTMSWGLGSSRPWTSSLLTSLGQVARNGTRRGRLEGCRDRRRGRPNPGSRPKPGNLRSLGKDLTCWSPSHPPNYGPSSGPIGLSPAQGRTYATCFLPVKSVDGYEELILSRRQEIGYFSIHLLRCLSVHLIDKRLATGPSLRRREVVRRSPYSGQLFPAWGKGVKACGFGPGSKGAWSSKRSRHDQRPRSTTLRQNDQVL